MMLNNKYVPTFTNEPLWGKVGFDKCAHIFRKYVGDVVMVIELDGWHCEVNYITLLAFIAYI
jgi:hypothetical protein